MGYTDIYISIWWSLLPGAVALLFFVVLVVFRRRRAAILSIAVALIIFLAGISWIASYRIRHLVIIDLDGKVSGNRYHYWNIFTDAGDGGVMFAVEEFASERLPTRRSRILIRSGKRNGPADGSYPLGGSRRSVIHSDAIEKTLGFQICWATYPDAPDYWVTLRWYSITVPHWFILTCCVPFPAFWIRHKLHRRYRTVRNLCSACGFDLRAHTTGEKCPECGHLIPASHKAPAMPDSAQGATPSESANK